jgi:hypothetical protein
MPSHPRRPITPVSSVCRVLEPHRAIRNTNARIGCGVGGRPGWRWVQRRATRWACQRSRVLGDTSRNRRSWVGSSLLRALRTARSSQVSVGRGLRRRSTATS